MANQNRDFRDDTVAEIHKTRRQIAEKFGGDIRAISADARKRQEQSGRVTISRGKPAQAANK